MGVFAFDDYKAFVNTEIEKLPQRGRGEYQRLAQALQMHSTSVSQVFKGQKDLTLEQAAKLCEYWGMGGEESDFLITLVELARAGNSALRSILRKRVAKMRERSQQLSSRIPRDRVLTEADKYQFYSGWHFSAIRLLTEMEEFSDPRSIAQHLQLPLSTVQAALDFLIETKLVTRENGRLNIGPSRTFIEATSPLVVRHHTNWRQKASERFPQMIADRDLAVTAPMTLSKKDAEAIRSLLLETLENVLAINTLSPSEELRVLNIDWLTI